MNNKQSVKSTEEIVKSSIETAINKAIAHAQDDTDEQQIKALGELLSKAVESWAGHANHNVYADQKTLIKELAEGTWAK